MTTQVASLYAEVGIKGLENVKSSLNSVKGELTQAKAGVGGLGDAFKELTGVSITGMGALMAVGGALKFCIDEAFASERVMAATAAVIKSTGGAAGITAEQVAKLAGAEMSLTGIADDVIQGGQNMLLTFRSIGADTFPRATRAMEDMAAAMAGGDIAALDLKGTAIQLGKALEDPINGVTALRRVGVMLTDQQEAQIKAFVALGDAASAQGIILAELEKEFGGMAEAMGGTNLGKIQKAKNAISELGEAIGLQLIPVLGDAAEATSLLMTWNEKVGSAVESQVGTVEKSAATYEDYARGVIMARSAITGYTMPANELNKVLKELATGNEESAKTFRVMTPAIWDATKATQAQTGASKELESSYSGLYNEETIRITTLSGLKEAAESYNKVAAESAKIQVRMGEVYNASVVGALELADANRELADKEKELANLNKEIVSQGPVRTAIDKKSTLDAEDMATAQAKLAASQAKLIALNQDLASAQKKKGESDAEYQARILGTRAQIAALNASIGDLGGKMTGHTITVGGATKAQLEHRDALLADIQAMKDQAKQAEGREMIKALDAGKMGADAYAIAVKQINDTYTLFTEQELKAATSHAILIDALSNAEGLSTAQDAIIAYYKSIGDAYGALMALIAAGKSMSEAAAATSAEGAQVGQHTGTPQFQTGGYMPYTGLAYLHAGERVLTPAQQRVTNNTRGGDTFTFNVNDSKSAAMFAQLIRQQREQAAAARMG